MKPLWIFSAPRAALDRLVTREFSQEDAGSHTVCAAMTADFLAFLKSRGNDLSTSVPEFGFPGLNAGDVLVPSLAAGR